MSTAPTTPTTISDADREAAIAFLRQIERMDVALLGSVVCCAFHVWVRRLGAWKGRPALELAT